MKTSLDHLPEPTRARLTAIADLLRAEPGVDMVILFGSYARTDWVADPEGPYYSDFDLLVVVATDTLARDAARWADLTTRARLLARPTPVTLIVHDLKEINHEIRLGQYFFVDILREGIALHDSRRVTLATPRALTPTERLDLALINFRYWYSSATGFWHTSTLSTAQGLLPQAAFLLHQSVERYYAAIALVFTGYKPKSHKIDELADENAKLHPLLAPAMPRADGEDKRLFDLLRRAYIEARYSRGFKVTAAELAVLRDRVQDLARRAREACLEKMASFCGNDALAAAGASKLPDPPGTTDLAAGELLTAPPDGGEEAWREALLAVGYARGRDAGVEEGFGRGEVHGQARALLTILSARAIAVDDASRHEIERCRDAALLDRWIARAMTATSVTELLAPDTTGAAS